MDRLLIIADDFTGALDTGVQFASYGALTCVVTNPDCDYLEAGGHRQVLVVDVESRHMTADGAYSAVFRASRKALEAGFTYIYKKTDSALRGNVGAELAAVLDAAKADGMAVFTDKGIEGAGLLDLPMAYVRQSGVEHTILDDLPAEPAYREAQKMVDQCKEYGADFIMAVGGGSVMDTAKLASILMTDEYGIRELLDDPGRAKKCIPTLMIPTTAGTGSEATQNAIVAVPEKQVKIGMGYEPEEAGEIEAVASTGGQVMPPIMGVGAFIMAEMLVVPYGRVASGAIIPALAYYFAVFVLVDRLAARRANRAGGDASIKVERKILPRLYLLLPALVLVYFIIAGYSLMRAGTVGIISCLVCNIISKFVNEGKDFVGLKGLWDCCVDGAKQAAEIAIPTAACGIIINVVTGQTSLATNLSGVISGMGTELLFVALLIGMVGCMLLGMALPTVAAYLVGVILFVSCIRPILIASGMEAATANFCANMFVFYYGIMAQITPPVCVASYTAAGIADGNALFCSACLLFLVRKSRQKEL